MIKRLLHLLSLDAHTYTSLSLSRLFFVSIICCANAQYRMRLSGRKSKRRPADTDFRNPRKFPRRRLDVEARRDSAEIRKLRKLVRLTGRTQIYSGRGASISPRGRGVALENRARIERRTISIVVAGITRERREALVSSGKFVSAPRDYTLAPPRFDR